MYAWSRRRSVSRTPPLVHTNQLSIARSTSSAAPRREKYELWEKRFPTQHHMPRSTDRCFSRVKCAGRRVHRSAKPFQQKQKSKLIVVTELLGSPGGPAAGVKVPRKIVRPPTLAARRPLPRGQRRPLYLPPGLLLVRFPRLLEGPVNLRGGRRSGLDKLA